MTSFFGEDADLEQISTLSDKNLSSPAVDRPPPRKLKMSCGGLLLVVQAGAMVKMEGAFQLRSPMND